MSASMALDPSRGFVALPLDVLEIEMTPGAFRTLVEFCRMADADGVCWPSLEQIGARLSRSRAAISGYVRELRELSLIETENQRTANGFNYRLRFRVTFWRTWKARFRRPPAGSSDRSAPERGVHPTERTVKKNQIQKNHPAAQRAPAEQPFLELHQAWIAHIGGAPYPAFMMAPPPSLLTRTRELAARAPIISADIKPALTAFFAARGIDLSPGDTAELTCLDRIAPIPGAPTLLRRALEDAWKPHWKRPPSRKFLADVIDRISCANPAPLIARLLAGHLRRWEIQQGRLAARGLTGDKGGTSTALYPRI